MLSCLVLSSYQSKFIISTGGRARSSHDSGELCLLSLGNLGSQVEWELVEIHVAGDGANFGAETSDLVSKHAWGRDLDGVVPIVVIVTERVREVKNRHLRDLRGVLGHVEVGGLDRTLGYRVGHKEEVELTVYDFGLLDEAVVNVGTLGRVVDVGRLAVVLLSLLEESLANTLVHDDQCDLRGLLLVLFRNVILADAVLKCHNLVKLGEFLVNDLLAHGITDTITVDEDVLGHLTVEVPVALEGTLEVVGQDGGRDDLLSLDWLWTGLCIVLAEVGVVSGTEADRGLLSLVADINSDQHGLV